MTADDMTPDERVVARQLQTLADIPVTELDVAHAHDMLRVRLGADPSDGASGTMRRTRIRLLAAAAAVVLVAAAAAVWTSTRPDQSPEPTHRLSRADRTAIRTATAFVDALSHFDVPQARRMLAPGAVVTGAVSTKGWPETIRFFQETGGQIDPAACQMSNRIGLGSIVDCPYRYQLLRSGALGLGPYGGSHFRISTQDGQITRVYMWHRTDPNGFSSQMWTPFATWIDTFHHHDGPKMYPDWPGQGHWPATNQEIRLWSQRTRQFVRFALHLCATTHQSVFAAACAGQRHGG